MINWQKIETYQNQNESMHIDSEPMILLYSPIAGVTTGKAKKWHDGEIMTIATGYHNFKWTHFAFVNLPED